MHDHRCIASKCKVTKVGHASYHLHMRREHGIKVDFACHINCKGLRKCTPTQTVQNATEK